MRVGTWTLQFYDTLTPVSVASPYPSPIVLLSFSYPSPIPLLSLSAQISTPPLFTRFSPRYLLREIAVVSPDDAATFLPLLAEVAGLRHFIHCSNLQETIWNQLPGIARGCGKKIFKRQLNAFIEPMVRGKHTPTLPFSPRRTPTPTPSIDLASTRPPPHLSCVPVYLCTMTTHVKRDILDNHFVCVG